MTFQNRACIALFALSFSLCAEGFARFHQNIIRGGQGLIFADSNSFINPGENSLNHGFSVETLGEYRKTEAGGNYVVGPSASLATYGFTLGGYYQRAGAEPGDKNTFEKFAGSFGTHFLFRRLTAGIVYARTKTSTQESADLYGTVTGHFGKIHPYEGFLLAAAANQQLGITYATTSYTVAAGYGKNRHSGYELNLTLHDIYNPSDWSVGAYYTQKKETYYWGAGLAYNQIRSVKFSGRIGWLNRHFDTSLYTYLPASAADTLQIGISIREVF